MARLCIECRALGWPTSKKQAQVTSPTAPEPPEPSLQAAPNYPTPYLGSERPLTAGEVSEVWKLTLCSDSVAPGFRAYSKPLVHQRGASNRHALCSGWRGRIGLKISCFWEQHISTKGPRKGTALAGNLSQMILVGVRFEPPQSWKGERSHG